MAYEAWNKGWTEEVDRLLERQAPRQGEIDYRGFDWKLLRELTWREPPIEFRGHDGPVNNVAVFANGTRLASVGEDATIRIWDLETHQQEFVLRDTRKTSPLAEGLTNELVDATSQPDAVFISQVGNDYRAVAVSPDGKNLVTGNLVLSLWDLEQRRLVRDLTVFPTRIFSAAFSPDGTLVAAHSGDEAVHVVSLRDGSLKRFETRHGAYRLCFSPDGTMLAAPYKSDTARGIRCWDTSSWDSTRDFQVTGINSVKPHMTRGMAYSGGGEFLFTATHYSDVHLLDAVTGKDLLRTPRQRAHVTDLALSPNDRMLAVTHVDGTLVIWKLRDGWHGDPSNAWDGQMTLLPAHEGAAEAVRFVDNRRLATCGDDGCVRVWTLHERPNYDRIVAPDLRLVSAFTPDGTELLIATSRGIRRYDAKTLNLMDQAEFWALEPSDPFAQTTEAIATSADGRYAAIGNRAGSIVILDASTHSVLHRIDQSDVRASSIDDIAFSPDGKWMANASRDHTVRVRSMDDYREVHRIHAQGWGANVEFSPDGRYLAYSDSEGALGLLETSTWRTIDLIQCRTATTPGTLHFTPNGTQLLTGHEDAVIRIWDAGSLSRVGQLKGHLSKINALAIHPDGTTVASTSEDQTTRLWHLGTQVEVGILSTADWSTHDCQFSPDGSQLTVMNPQRTYSARMEWECRIWRVKRDLGSWHSDDMTARN